MSELNVSRENILDNIVVDQEFKSLIPALTNDEYTGLEENIISEGCRDAIVLWNNIIVDGHNRYEICTNHNIPFQTVQKEFSDRDDAKLWMMHNQLSRRNLNDMQRVAVVRKCEDSVKAKAKERQATSTGGMNPQLMEKFPQAEKGSTRDKLGAMAGVSGKTYEHAAVVLETAPAPVVEAAMRNDISINTAYQVAKMEPEKKKEIAKRIENIDKEPKETSTPKAIIQEVVKRPHVVNNSGNNEWYTPAKYIDLARDVLGTIDVDPASCEYANQTVKAKTYYSIEDDGLNQSWHGKVWMNPPYSADLVQKFSDKMVNEFESGNTTEAIVLVNNATETQWFSNMVTQASAVAFPKGRIRYESPTHEMNSPLQGQAFIYFGQNKEKFCDTFKKIGWVAVLE